MDVPAIYHDGSSPQELYFIASIENAVSVLTHGILSHKRAAKIHHIDIADQEVQLRRERKIVPNPDRMAQEKQALTIHRHANLYIRAHNAMLYVKKEQRNNLCVFRIDPRILARTQAVIADRNASKDAASFHQATPFRFSPVSSAMLKERLSFIWKDPEEEKRKGVKQAEVLVPYQVHPSFIQGIYVANTTAQEHLVGRLNGTPFQDQLPIDLHPSLFFSEERKERSGANPLDAIHPAPLRNGLYPILHEELPESSDEEEAQAEHPFLPFQMED